MNRLTEYEKSIIDNKGTEPRGSGLYNHHSAKGFYQCKKCAANLYRSEHKFPSTCGWPSFDDEIPDAVNRLPDADGLRIEILCNNCGAHLGHIFEGERLTDKNVRHCVNSASLTFKPVEEGQSASAIFASGCFWGTEYFLGRLPGVIQTEVGYIGGEKKHPTYEEVCQGTTGHVEAVQVYYDTLKVTYEDLAILFFETHNFSQRDGQGPDIGTQYRSKAFPKTEEEKTVLNNLIDTLKSKGYEVATQIESYSTFWKAEEYHQNYYEKGGQSPYCHTYSKIFERG